MKDKLYEKLEDELKKYKEKIKERGVDFAIDRAYEITVKQEIINTIKYDNTVSNTQIKALLSRENVLDELYDDWLSTIENIRENINYSVEESIDIITDNYKKEHKKDKAQER